MATRCALPEGAVGGDCAVVEAELEHVDDLDFGATTKDSQRVSRLAPLSPIHKSLHLVEGVGSIVLVDSPALVTVVMAPVLLEDSVYNALATVQLRAQRSGCSGALLKEPN